MATKKSATGNGKAHQEQMELLKTSEGRYRQLFEDAPLAAWELDFSVVKTRLDKIRATGVTSFRDYFKKHPQVATGFMSMVSVNAVNHAALTLFKADRNEFLRYGLAAIYGDKNTGAFTRELIAIAERTTAFTGEITTQTLTGETRCVVLQWHVPASYADSYSKVLVGAVDITARELAEQTRKQLDEQARQIEKLRSLSELSGQISHDFNNVLMIVLGYSEILRSAFETGTSECEMMAQIEGAARRAADLTRQLGIYSGTSKPVTAKVNLTTVTQQMAPALQEKSLLSAILKIDLSDRLPDTEADAAQVRQVVDLLVQNAVESIGGKVGIITLRSGTMECDAGYLKSIFASEKAPSGGYVYLEVTDTGSGLTPEEVARLFVPFDTMKGRPNGGLGLSMALGIMKSHNGAIAVQSEPGSGTSIKLLFPSLGTVAKGGDTQADKTPWKGHGLVLVIDDEPMIRDVLRIMLKRLGFEVLMAPDGKAGLDLYRNHGHEIVAVLLDIIMPGMSSEDTFRAIRKQRKDAIVVLSSGASEEQARQQFSAEGVSGFIRKPYQQSELSEALRNILGA